MLGGRLRDDGRYIRPHQPMRLQLLGTMLSVEGPGRHVLRIDVNADAPRLAALEPTRQGTQQLPRHARSAAFGNNIEPLEFPITSETTSEVSCDEPHDHPVFGC